MLFAIPFILQVLLMLGGFFLIAYAIWYNSPSQKGKRGEESITRLLTLLPEEYTTLNDIVFRTENGTTQIDHIVVSKYGVFAIETKNYRGDIYGDDEKNEWKQIIVTKVTYRKKWWKTYTYVTKSQFYNPVKQSLGHAFIIKDLLKTYPNLKIVPIVVFVGNAILKRVESNHHVLYAEELLPTIKGYTTSFLRDEDVQDVINILQNNNVRDVVNNNEHIRNIRAARIKMSSTIHSGICPKCGGRLIERHGKYGTFLGCSNYPSCKFTTQ